LTVAVGGKTSIGPLILAASSGDIPKSVGVIAGGIGLRLPDGLGCSGHSDRRHLPLWTLRPLDAPTQGAGERDQRTPNGGPRTIPPRSGIDR